MKYDKMVAINQEKNREKIEIAKRAIGEMLNRKERISVTSLSRNTGFAKSFFYRNKEVRMTLDNALLQQGECYNPKKVIFRGYSFVELVYKAIWIHGKRQ